MFRIRGKPPISFLSLCLLVLALLALSFAPHNRPQHIALAQDDPAVGINQLAEAVHLQNLRTNNVTLWIGGTLGRLNGSELGIGAGTSLTDWNFTNLYNENEVITFDNIQRPVVINIWASWCGPCRYEFPFLADNALDNVNNYDLWFLNSGDTSPAAARRFLADQREGVIAYLDPEDAFARLIRLRVYPTTVMLDTDGTLIAAHSGVVTPTLMRFFNAIAAYPRLGNLDTVSIVPPPAIATINPVDAAAALPIIYGQQVVGELTDEKWQVNYRFEGKAGEEVTIDMTAPEDDFDTYLVLLDANGQRLAENDDGPVWPYSQIQFRLPADGTYLIVATRFLEADGFAVGAFTLRLTIAGQEATASSDNPSVAGLTIGIPSSARLSRERTQEVYLLQATAGQELRFTLEHDTPEEILRLEVRLGASERLIRFMPTENGRLEVDLPITRDGAYSVYVSRPSRSRAAPITFTLTVTDLTQSTEESSTDTSEPTTPPSTEAVPINTGETVEGSLDATVYERFYIFDGNSGDTVTIRMTATEGQILDTTLRLLDSQGTLLAENDDANLQTTNSEITAFVLPTSSTYTIVATRFGGAEGINSGSFTLTLEVVPAVTVTEESQPPTDTPVTTESTSLSYGNQASGSLSSEVFEVEYTFTGSIGDVVNIRMNAQAGALVDTYLYLFGPSGDLIAENDDADLTTTDAAILTFELPESGVYRILATRFGGEVGLSAGDFTLTLEAVSLATGEDNPTEETVGESQPAQPVTPVSTDTTVLSINSTVTGAVDNSSLRQLYTFSGKAGEVITISMRATGGDLDAYLSLLDPAGNEIAFNDDELANLQGTQDAVIANFILPVDGTYTIVATRYGAKYGATAGAFELTLSAGGL